MSMSSSGGTLRTLIRRLSSLTASETTLVSSGHTPPNNRVLIVGLGNYPAPRSRHSVGQYLLHRIAERNSVELSYKRACKSHLASFAYNDAEVFLLKPKHFMNLSGKSVLKATTRFQISPSNVLLLHDELDLELGKFKVKNGGSANGHNGVLDTHERLKSNEMKRLRIGIGRPNNRKDVLDYVLEDFSTNERNLLAAMSDTLVDTVYKTISIMMTPPDKHEAHLVKLNTALGDLPEWQYEACETASPRWTPPSPRDNDNILAARGGTSSRSDTLTTVLMLGALHKVNYNNSANRSSRYEAPATPSPSGRRRYSGETVPQIFPYDDQDVRHDYNKRESKISRESNKRLDYRHFRRDRRDSDSSRD